jgi:hypothetical protein
MMIEVYLFQKFRTDSPRPRFLIPRPRPTTSVRDMSSINVEHAAAEVIFGYARTLSISHRVLMGSSSCSHRIGAYASELGAKFLETRHNLKQAP